MKLSDNFRLSEFACNCGCKNQPEVPPRLIEILEEFRFHFGRPIKINSSYRCYKHNKYVGGSVNSQHLVGKAADIVIRDTEPKKVQEYFDTKYPNSFGMGKYNTFTHIDVRSEKARW